MTTRLALESIHVTFNKKIAASYAVNVEIETGQAFIKTTEFGEYNIKFSSLFNKADSVVQIRISIQKSDGGWTARLNRRRLVYLIDETFHSTTPWSNCNVMYDDKYIYIDNRFFKMTFELRTVVQRSTVPIERVTMCAVIPEVTDPAYDMLNESVMQDLIKKGILRGTHIGCDCRPL